MIFARSQSILGQNVLFCAQRYHRSISDIVYNPNNSNCISAFAHNSVDYETHTAANLLTELLMLRDHAFYFSNDFSLSQEELNDMIIYICMG